MYSTPVKNILTKCADVKDLPTRFFVQMGLSVPSAGAANFDNTQCRAQKCSLLSSSVSVGSREAGTFEFMC